MESGISAMIGALAGINMISGAGMLDFLACQSPEKLVVDAEGIAMAQRMVAGIEVRTETLATALFEGINFKGDFLKQKITRELILKRTASFLRLLLTGTPTEAGRPLAASIPLPGPKYVRKSFWLLMSVPVYSAEQDLELRTMVENLARKAGMDALPPN